MLSKHDFCALVTAHLPFDLTEGQNQALQQMAVFICEQIENRLFILKGYAGTGKTTLMSAIVKSLLQMRQCTVLLAPTGRSAKVFSSYAHTKAYTIHKMLYRVSKKDEAFRLIRKKNVLHNALFIVDEVSMLSSSSVGDLSQRSLLDDLMQFVYEGDNCKMIFIGDDAQLPPVYSDESPALDIEFLHRNFNMGIDSCLLTDVVRQANDSGILFNANILRKKIMQRQYNFPLFTKQLFPDFFRINGADLEELLNTLYGKYNIEDLVLITRSNRHASLFNEEIRRRVLFRDNAIAAGDYLMAIKNNYYWVDETSEVGFLANGDIMEILSINKQEQLYGFHFADVTVRLCDYPDFDHIDIKLILESLKSPETSLNATQQQLLYEQIALDYQDIKDRRLRYLKIKNDPYLNAVQVKFSYSLTCNKTQGGQWRIALINQVFMPDNMLNKEYLRWLYTALTRATETVYLVNFGDENFG
ncbi:MAG: AAA family ATPase [Bacteroidales bacterium]|jgi:exodeoxyribonuclease-5|nr:AAA family ATPase [Bacteroidales bacterium]